MKHHTQWGELAPSSQQALLQLEQLIVAAREDSRVLDSIPRLRGGEAAGALQRRDMERAAKVGQCRLTESKPVLTAQRLWFQHLNLEYHESLSNFAFKFNLRRYTKGASGALKGLESQLSSDNERLSG